MQLMEAGLIPSIVLIHHYPLEMTLLPRCQTCASELMGSIMRHLVVRIVRSHILMTWAVMRIRRYQVQQVTSLDSEARSQRWILLCAPSIDTKKSGLCDFERNNNIRMTGCVGNNSHSRDALMGIPSREFRMLVVPLQPTVADLIDSAFPKDGRWS
ncbi:hypothetical protein K491DRAFT_499785 [Lophiostoma macrostomum CBS 122681]|uniref:Uncharacterized protein n=1 Tax=Lophiostoma macrostomum CBS 122681 TaxID=1314788 RepID=A0A6A6T2D4_9PLEO|nr:hypothetical protein K491DRAFT_499785 [Lophiostoma macrostomum CBS 122681]